MLAFPGIISPGREDLIYMTAPTVPDTATCGACRATFADVELFDAHRLPTRTRSRCRRPAELGMVARGGVWHRAPMSPADRLARYRAVRAQGEITG